MKRLTASPLKIAALGTVIAGLIVGITLVFLSPSQCPAEYTQAQVEASGCAVGANIGAGIAMLAAALIWVTSMVAAVIMWFVRRK